MSVRTIMVLVLALAFGGSAAVGVSALVGAKTPGSKGVETVPIVVAAADIARGGTITPELVKVRDCPRGLVPAGAASKLEDVLERAVFTPLVKDEPVLEGKLTPKGGGRGMASLIPPGMRAFTIQTQSVTSGVAGFIMPGNRVDVLLTITQQGDDAKTGGAITNTLLQNVEILAVDQRIDAPAENRVDVNEMRSVTLLVSPDQAAKLDLGQTKGILHLALRNLKDNTDAGTRPTTFNDLRFFQDKPWDERARGVIDALGKVMAQRKPEAEPAAAPAPPTILVQQPEPPRSVRIYRGTQWSLAD